MKVSEALLLALNGKRIPAKTLEIAQAQEAVVEAARRIDLSESEAKQSAAVDALCEALRRLDELEGK